MDYGIEIVTDSSAPFSLTWDPPGQQEGIGLQPVPMLGSAVLPDADVAIWDVRSSAVSWAPLLGREVTGVDLHSIPWDEPNGSLWCPHITFRSETGRVEIIMGDADQGTLVPSADNVAVLHPGAPWPDWYHLRP